MNKREYFLANASLIFAERSRKGEPDNLIDSTIATAKSFTDAAWAAAPQEPKPEAKQEPKPEAKPKETARKPSASGDKGRVSKK